MMPSTSQKRELTPLDEEPRSKMKSLVASAKETTPSSNRSQLTDVLSSLCLLILSERTRISVSIQTQHEQHLLKNKQVISDLTSRGEPLCIEVNGGLPNTAIDGVMQSILLPADDSHSDTTPSCHGGEMLIEKWMLQIIPYDSVHTTVANTTSIQFLTQAVKSFLYFSQINSWSVSNGGRCPFNLFHRVYCIQGSSSNTTVLPESHRFPLVHCPECPNDCIKVCVTYLPRLVTIPRPLLSNLLPVSMNGLTLNEEEVQIHNPLSIPTSSDSCQLAIATSSDSVRPTVSSDSVKPTLTTGSSLDHISETNGSLLTNTVVGNNGSSIEHTGSPRFVSPLTGHKPSATNGVLLSSSHNNSNSYSHSDGRSDNSNGNGTSGKGCTGFDSSSSRLIVSRLHRSSSTSSTSSASSNCTGINNGSNSHTSSCCTSHNTSSNSVSSPTTSHPIHILNTSNNRGVRPPGASSPIPFLLRRTSLTNVIDSKEKDARKRLKRRSCGIYSSKTPSCPPPPTRSMSLPAVVVPNLCLLGTFEESVLNGRMNPLGYVEGYMAELGASGSFCPQHITFPVLASFFSLSDDRGSSPYLGHVDLTVLKKRGYRVPSKGTVQLTLFNPNKTVVKIFIVVYDHSDMPANTTTFIRQKTLSRSLHKKEGEDGSSNDLLPCLQYLIHLRFLCSKSGHIYLHTDIKMLFPWRAPDADPDLSKVSLYTLHEGPVNPKYGPLSREQF